MHSCIMTATTDMDATQNANATDASGMPTLHHWVAGAQYSEVTDPATGKVTARLTGHRDNIALLKKIVAENG